MCALVVAATIFAIVGRTQTINRRDVGVDNGITTPIIQCRNNTDCNIDCSLSNDCQYTTIYCSAAEYSCNIKCGGYRNCYNTVIISYSYNLSLICDPYQSEQSCYNMSAAISYTGGAQSKSKSVANIDCLNTTTSDNCAYSSFYIANIDEININCDGQRGCGDATFVISDSNTVNLDCNSYFSCFGTNIHITNTFNTNLVCNYRKSCYDVHIDGRNNKVQMKLICVNDDSCSNIYLSCDTKQFQACYIDCFTNHSCSNIYIPVYTNDYTQDFLYFNPNTTIWNAYDLIYIQCYSPISNNIIHTTYITINNGSYSCNDNICCPFKTPNSRNVFCEENSECVVYCGDDTGCNWIDASKAISLNLTCANCIASKIICPYKYSNSICTVSCIATCEHALIRAGSAKNLEIDCIHQGCQYMDINTIEAQHVIITCDGSSCQKTNITVNSAGILNINCMYNGCNYMRINANNVQQMFLNCSDYHTCEHITLFSNYGNETQIYCDGESSCDWSYINVSNVDNVTIFSQPNFTRTDKNLYSLQYTTIITTTATNLEMTCISDISANINYNVQHIEQIACYETKIYIGNNARLQCNGTACKNLGIYSNKNSITNQQLNVLLNDCELCGSDLCINEWEMQCGNHRRSEFDGTCSNYYCCQENIFIIDNDYSVCVPGEWKNFDNDLLYYFGLTIPGIISFGFVMMIFELMYHIYIVGRHKFYQLPFKPPLFILRYVHIIDFAMSLTFIYIVFCFAKTRNHVLSYCSSKYSSRVSFLCNADIHCSTNRYRDCGVSSVLNGLSVTYYVFFGIYFALNGGYYVYLFNNIENNIVYDSTTWTLRSLHCIHVNDKHLWKTQVIGDYVANKHFKGIHDHWRYPFFFILFALSIFANFFTELYVLCQWFVLYPILFSMIISEFLKVYYRGLPPFDEGSVIKFIIIDKFGYDIGNILFQYLDIYWSRQTFFDSKQQSLLASHKFSINN